MLCPFHAEKTSSFTVNIKEEYFYCFGCGVGGDVFTFVMLDQKVGFGTALQYLARRKGIPLNQSYYPEAEQGQREIEKALNEAAILYHRGLPEEIRAYLRKRGLSDETIDKYQVGFCAGNTTFTLDHDILKKAGLFYDDGGEYFKGFITFPNMIAGRVVYISGRGYPQKKHKKLSKEKVPLAHLYQEPAIQHPEVILAEGEIDTLTLLQNGFNACGVLGAGSFKEDWARKFNNCETVYLTFDADSAGEQANQKVAQMLGNKAQIVTLPQGKDVNDFLQSHTASEFQQLLDTSLNLIEQKIQQIPQDTDRVKLAKVLDPVLKELSEINPLQADMILGHGLKEHFKLSQKDIQSFAKVLKNYRQETKNKESLNKNELLAILRNEEHHLAIHPSQDYAKGLMNFTVKIKNEPYLLTSDRGLICFADTSASNIFLREVSVDTTRFSYTGIHDFLKNEKTINISDLYQRIFEYIQRFIRFPHEGYAALVALWVMGTYIFMIFRYYPYMWLNAEKGSGKTLLMEVLSAIAFNGELMTNPTESVIPFQNVCWGETMAEVESTPFGIASMGLAANDLEVEYKLNIKRRDKDVEEDFEFTPVRKTLPTALFGEKLQPDLNGEKFVKDALCGLEIRPKDEEIEPEEEVDSDEPPHINLDKLRIPSEEVKPAFFWEQFSLTSLNDTDDANRRETIKENLSEETKRQAQAERVKDLGFDPAEVDLSPEWAEDFLVAPQIIA